MVAEDALLFDHLNLAKFFTEVALPEDDVDA